MTERPYVPELGLCCQCGLPNDYPLAAVCTACQRENIRQWREERGLSPTAQTDSVKTGNVDDAQTV